MGLGGGPWPGFDRIGLVEVGDEFGSMRELRCQKPRGFFICTFVTDPLCYYCSKKILKKFITDNLPKLTPLRSHAKYISFFRHHNFNLY